MPSNVEGSVHSGERPSRGSVTNAYYAGRTLDPARVRQQAVEKIGPDADALFDADGRMCAEEPRLTDALELIEGRLFRDPMAALRPGATTPTASDVYR